MALKQTRQLFLTPLLIALILQVTSSCATLSKEQLKSIETFSTACDNFSLYPSLLFTEIADVRLERGKFYAASLNDAQNRIDELNALHKAHEQDLLLAAKYDASLKILQSYSNALNLLVSDNRSKTRGTEFRSLGRTLDSLIIEVNTLKIFTDALPTGIAKSAATIVAYGAENLLKVKQHRLTRAFVSEADTLIQVLVTSLVQTLQDPKVAVMIENEKSALPANYKSFLLSRGNTPVDPQFDNQYLELLDRCEQFTYSRGYTTSAAKRLAKTHRELALSLKKGKNIGELIAQLSKLIADIEMLQKQYNKIISLT
ncbi:MAG: hypothetical protein WCW86_08300 [Bacteroidales bacterium]